MKSSSQFIKSDFLGRSVQLEILEPDVIPGDLPTGLLLINDGQLSGTLNIKKTAQQLMDNNKIIPLKIVAIHAGIRQLEYGVTGEADYMGRGAKAGDYERFIMEELLEQIQQSSVTAIDPKFTAFAGCSLGGLSAFDIAISNPASFGNAGVFSGSLWWRSKCYEHGYTDNDRILFKKLSGIQVDKNFRCFLMAGTNDEPSDRNNNGIIDSVDDTLDMFDVLVHGKNIAAKNVCLDIVQGGEHNTTTWSNQFPGFISFTFDINRVE